ncbi:MAG: hypothetical protein M3Q67_07395, partial [Actinomycetota bacterium]|nr:hypothetical protein [Actinomycetota bacterium]
MLRAHSGDLARDQNSRERILVLRTGEPVDAGFTAQLPFRPFDGAGRAPPSISEGIFLKDVILTPEGYKQLKSELDRLRTEKRREIAERIAAARAFGEIAENAEYDDAKNEQMMLEHRIAQ